MSKYIGLKFNNLTCLQKSESVISGGRKRSAYLFRCDCGLIKKIIFSSVLSNNTKSCGCIKSYNNNLPINKKVNYKELLMFKDCQRSAKNRNIIFDLDFDYFLIKIKEPCHYCFSFNESNINGIDRMDNKVGYLKYNSVPCCSVCNRGKRDMSYEKFKIHISKIVLNHNKNNNGII